MPIARRPVHRHELHSAPRGIRIRVLKAPVLFVSTRHTVVGPYDIRIPRGSTKTDCEVELAVVIGVRLVT